MHKELNPDLFGDSKNSKTLIEEGGLPKTTLIDPPFLNIDKQMLDLRNQMKNLLDQVNKVILSFNENVKISNSKFERVHMGLGRVEQLYNEVATDYSNKLNLLNSKISERKMIEQKIQEMVDRHNNIIHTFEVRLGQMQKLLAEKESQLVTTQSLLNETKMELARLKRL